jgi:hypothetical protein
MFLVFHHISSSYGLQRIRVMNPLLLISILVKGKGKAIPLQALTDSGVSRRLRLPDFKTIGT